MGAAVALAPPPPAPPDAAPRRNASNLYRSHRTGRLVSDLEAAMHTLTELETDLETDPSSWAFPDGSRAYLAWQVAEMAEELAWREHRRHRSTAPPWPDRWRDRRAEVDAIRAAVDLADFIERVSPTHLHGRGRERVGACPFPDHQDAHPSFKVSPHKQVFHCWGCGRSGDLFTFAAMYFALDHFGDVVEFLAGYAGVPRG